MSTCLHVWAGHAAHPFRKPQQGLVLRGVSQTLQHSDHTLHLTSSPWHVMHTHCYSNHYGLEMITPWSLSLISLVTQIPHWERPTFSPQKAVFASWNATHLSRFVLNASDSVHPSLTRSVGNGFLQQWSWALCVQWQLSPCAYLGAWPTQMLHKCAAGRGEGQNGRKKTWKGGSEEEEYMPLPPKYQFWKAKLTRTQQGKWMSAVALQT